MKMKAYPSFDACQADQTRPIQAVLRALRRFVRKTVPALEETVKWGNGCWVKGKKPVAFAYCAPDHVQFGFFIGSALKDPKKLLQGSSRYVRHLKLRKPADLDARAFAALLKEAAKTPYAQYTD